MDITYLFIYLFLFILRPALYCPPVAKEQQMAIDRNQKVWPKPLTFFTFYIMMVLRNAFSVLFSLNKNIFLVCIFVCLLFFVFGGRGCVLDQIDGISIDFNGEQRFGMRVLWEMSMAMEQVKLVTRGTNCGPETSRFSNSSDINTEMLKKQMPQKRMCQTHAVTGRTKLGSSLSVEMHHVNDTPLTPVQTFFFFSAILWHPKKQIATWWPAKRPQAAVDCDPAEEKKKFGPQRKARGSKLYSNLMLGMFVWR